MATKVIHSVVGSVRAVMLGRFGDTFLKLEAGGPDLLPLTVKHPDPGMLLGRKVLVTVSLIEEEA